MRIKYHENNDWHLVSTRQVVVLMIYILVEDLRVNEIPQGENMIQRKEHGKRDS